MSSFILELGLMTPFFVTTMISHWPAKSIEYSPWWQNNQL